MQAIGTLCFDTGVARSCRTVWLGTAKTCETAMAFLETELENGWLVCGRFSNPWKEGIPPYTTFESNCMEVNLHCESIVSIFSFVWQFDHYMNCTVNSAEAMQAIGTLCFDTGVARSCLSHFTSCKLLCLETPTLLTSIFWDLLKHWNCQPANGEEHHVMESRWCLFLLKPCKPCSWTCQGLKLQVVH